MSSKEILIVGKFFAPIGSLINLQLLSKAHFIAKKRKSKVSFFLIEEQESEDFDLLYKYGADIVYYCKEKNTCTPLHICRYLSDIIRKNNIEAVFFPAEKEEKEAAAFLSVQLDCGLTADCIEVDYDNQRGYLFSRAAMNDSVIAQIAYVNCSVALGTFKEGVFIAKETGRENREDAVKRILQTKENSQINKTKIIEKLEKKKETSIVDLSHITFAFCIGRGVKEIEMVRRIRKIADAFHAELVGTRAAVEEQLIEKARQVGQSGKSIVPKIYVGFGVSGACQHIVGIKNSDVIIAVNNDPNAPIFNYADYSIIADLGEIVSAMEAIIKSRAL